MSGTPPRGTDRNSTGKLPPLRRIVLPTDLSEDAYRSLPYVDLLAKSFGAEVHLLHVLPDHGMEDARLSYWAHGHFQTEVFLKDAWERLRKDQARLGLEFAKVRIEVRLGSPAATIDAYAREVGADLIVMCPHALAWWERLLVGSISEETLRSAPCPVLMIPPDCPATAGG